MKSGGLIWIILYLIFGAYFINFGLNFIPVSEIVSNFDNWIILVGGVLILVGGINHLRANKNYKKMVAAR